MTDQNDSNRETSTARRHRVTPNNPVEALRIAETGEVFWLPEGGGGDWTIGASSRCDLVLNEPHVSRVHCAIERDSGATFVRDNGSKNGTMLDGVRCDRGEIVDGSTIMLGSSRLVAVSRESQRAHDHLRQLLGWGLGQLERVESALQLARTHAHVLIVGEKGTEPERLARLVHASSLRRDRRFVVVPAGVESQKAQEQLLHSASFGTLYAEIALLPQRRDRLIDSLIDDSYDLRLIGVSGGRADAVRALGTELASLMMGIELPPLRTRMDDLPRLIKAILHELSAEHGKVPILSESDLIAMASYNWPKNLAELRRTVEYLVALSIHGSSRTAADALGVPRSTLKNRLRRIGLDDGPRTLREL